MCFLLYFVKDKLLNCCKAKCERNQQCSLRSSPALPFYMLSFRCCRQNVLMLDYQMTFITRSVSRIVPEIYFHFHMRPIFSKTAFADKGINLFKNCVC